MALWQRSHRKCTIEGVEDDTAVIEVQIRLCPRLADKGEMRSRPGRAAPEAERFLRSWRISAQGYRSKRELRARARTLTLPVAIVMLANLASGQEPPAPAPEPVPSQAVPVQTPTAQDNRIFGVIPNYRTAEGSDPFVPISTSRKFAIATKDTFDYPSYGLAAAFAGLSQLQNDNPSFGQGLKGYARRYGSAAIDQDLGNYMTEAIIPSLLREDPRYFRRGSGSFLERAAYAASRVLITRTDAGNPRFNTSEFLGNGIVASVGNLYYPDDVGLRYTAQRMFTQIGSDAIDNVLKEFWPDFKRRWLSHHN